jgi:hypothetical protein
MQSTKMVRHGLNTNRAFLISLFLTDRRQIGSNTAYKYGKEIIIGEAINLATLLQATGITGSPENHYFSGNVQMDRICRISDSTAYMTWRQVN